MNCRFCKTELSFVFIDLGNAPPSNSYLTADQLNEPETYYALKLFVCPECFLVQADEYKKAETIFNNDYAYFSSTSTSWLKHSEKYVHKMISEFGINKDSFVTEIASNDGYLLQYFKKSGIGVLGIEPALSVANAAINRGIETCVDFFGIRLAEQLKDQKKQADLILGNNVLAHVPDINDFVAGLKIGLKPEGLITMEFPHILQLIANNQFDTIYHEHFSYFSFITVLKIFEFHNLTLFHVEELPTHGGSLRIYARHTSDNSKPIRESVISLKQREEGLGLNSLEYYKGFQNKAKKAKLDFLDFLVTAKKQEKKVASYGAAAKGNTLLNFCGVKNDLIQFVVDAAPSKQGKYLPGSHIPILKESELKNFKPDYVIIFPWNIKEEITEQLEYIIGWDGKFVVAVPSLKIFK
jgi:2-polyprenyl-3-methyl-5-hydroxy-6-metoxy-1,4-benzoquinol methylase